MRVWLNQLKSNKYALGKSIRVQHFEFYFDQGVFVYVPERMQIIFHSLYF
jgi:hypothetical protein